MGVFNDIRVITEGAYGKSSIVLVSVDIRTPVLSMTPVFQPKISSLCRCLWSKLKRHCLSL
jgi:hypothetical protein